MSEYSPWPNKFGNYWVKYCPLASGLQDFLCRGLIVGCEFLGGGSTGLFLNLLDPGSFLSSLFGVWGNAVFGSQPVSQSLPAWGLQRKMRKVPAGSRGSPAEGVVVEQDLVETAQEDLVLDYHLLFMSLCWPPVPVLDYSFEVQY